MTFEEAEKKFRELQARVQRGEPISRADYEEQVAQLAVQDERGVLWEINPRTGKWMYFDGAEWVVGRPPGHDQSTVMPISQLTQAAPPPPTPTPQQRPPTPSATPPPARPIISSQPAKPPSPATPRSAAPTLPPRPAVPTPPSPRPTAPTSPSSRPAAPTTGAPASKVPPSPETVQPWTQKRAPTAGAKAPGAGQKPARVIAPLAGTNREWIPLAIGAVVLLFCAIVLFVGVNLFFGSSGRPTPTRPVARTTNTPESTVVRLPTATPPPPTPAPVLAKIIERTANVRTGPGKTFKVISTLKKDSQITLIGRNEATDWFQVNVAGSTQPGWISREVLEITSGDPNSLAVAEKATATPTKKPAAPVGPQATPSLTPIGGPTPTPSS